jgi:hypothetical protein
VGELGVSVLISCVKLRWPNSSFDFIPSFDTLLACFITLISNFVSTFRTCLNLQSLFGFSFAFIFAFLSASFSISLSSVNQIEPPTFSFSQSTQSKPALAF